MGIPYPVIGGSYTLAQLEALAIADYFASPDDAAFTNAAVSCAATYRAGDAGDGSSAHLLFGVAIGSVAFGTGIGRPEIAAKVRASDVTTPAIDDTFEISTVHYAVTAVSAANGGWLLTLKAPS